MEEALEDAQRLSEELDKVKHNIRESERNVGFSLETLQVISVWLLSVAHLPTVTSLALAAWRRCR